MTEDTDSENEETDDIEVGHTEVVDDDEDFVPLEDIKQEDEESTDDENEDRDSNDGNTGVFYSQG